MVLTSVRVSIAAHVLVYPGTLQSKMQQRADNVTTELIVGGGCGSNDSMCLGYYSFAITCAGMFPCSWYDLKNEPLLSK